MKNRYTVAFDPGLNLGWALIKNGKYINSGIYKNDARVAMNIRQLHISNLIDSLIRNDEITTVAVEAINRVSGKKTFTERNEHTWVLSWVYGEIMRLSTIYNKEFVAINPLTMKAAVTQGRREPGSNGPAQKAEVKKVIQETVIDKKMRCDESDAIGIGLTDWKLFTGEYEIKTKRKKNEKGV